MFSDVVDVLALLLRSESPQRLFFVLPIVMLFVICLDRKGVSFAKDR
jgi:hypothetical protein